MIPGLCSIMRAAMSRVGSPSGARPAEDAQHVVLLQRDSVRLDDARERRPHAVRGAEQRHDGLVGRRREGLRLPDLAPNRSHDTEQDRSEILD